MDAFDGNCDLKYIDWQSTVKNIEKALQIKTSESRIEGVAAQDLETAAQIVLYLSSCPKKSLLLFYMDLFQYQPLNHIVLTLNRIINGKSENELSDFLFQNGANKVNSDYSLYSLDLFNME